MEPTTPKKDWMEKVLSVGSIIIGLAMLVFGGIFLESSISARRRLFIIFLCTVLTTFFAAYLVFKKPTVDEHVLNGFARIAMEHDMERLPDAPDSTDERDYVRLTRTYEIKDVSEAELKQVTESLGELCIGWNAGSLNDGAMTWWDKDWGLIGQQSILLRWNPVPDNILTIEYFCQKRNYGYLLRGLMPEPIRPDY